jgi:hypothetical protein
VLLVDFDREQRAGSSALESPRNVLPGAQETNDATCAEHLVPQLDASRFLVQVGQDQICRVQRGEGMPLDQQRLGFVSRIEHQMDYWIEPVVAVSTWPMS